MTSKQEKKLVQDYGITDPGPVLARYRKLDAEIEKIASKSITALQIEIEKKKRKAKAEKILGNLE